MVNKKDIDYYNFLKDKKVCIVGPAPHLIDSNKSEFIESYDIIVRLNRSFPVSKKREKDIGKRTDIFYNCLNPEPDSGGSLNLDLIKNNVKYLSMPYPDIFPFNIDIARFNYFNNNYNIPFHIMDLETYKIVSSEMGTRPNTGVLAIIDILSYPVKELYVTGISFFRGGYDIEYRDKVDGIKVKDQKHSEQLALDRMRRSGNHTQEGQIQYIKKIFKSDDRFKGDEIFEKIMNE
jgi:hypothetical protein